MPAEIPPPVSLSRPLLHRGDRSAKRGAPLPGWALLTPHPTPPIPTACLPARLPSCGVHPTPAPHHHTLPSLIPPKQPRSASRGCRGVYERLTGGGWSGLEPRPGWEEGGGAVEFWHNAAECTTCRYCIELVLSEEDVWLPRGRLHLPALACSAVPLKLFIHCHQ